MSSRWRIPDLIDLEYFLSMDALPVASDDRSRPGLPDRELFLSSGEDKQRDRRSLVKLWLDHRRNVERAAASDPVVLPGEIFTEVRRWLSIAFFVAGCAAGASLTVSLLNYTGVQPVNVSLYFGAFVLTQGALLMALTVLMLVRMTHGSAFTPSPLHSMAGRFWGRLMMAMKERMAHALTGEQRHGMEAAAGMIRGKRTVYGSLFFIPVFILFQLFAVGFNLAVLSATLFKVLGSDIAFGWQSTLKITPDLVYGIVRFLAIPWSSRIPADMAFPSPAQIEGSRMVLKDGIWRLATPDLVSWWPFLWLCVLFYGLIPRLVLLTGAAGWQRRLIARLTFDTAPIDRLILRMTTPAFSFQGAPAPKDRENPHSPSSDTANAPLRESAGGGATVLVPDDIFDSCDDRELQDRILRTFGHGPLRKIRMNLFERPPFTGNALPDPPVVVIQEAWQPPIQEHLTFLRELRKSLGSSAAIGVGLIGKPASRTIFTSVTDLDWRVWEKKLAVLGDPRLRMERLAPDEN